jgi:hypothetical protein
MARSPQSANYLATFLRFLDRFAREELDVSLLEHRTKGLFGYVGLERPTGSLTVMCRQLLEKFQREAANQALLAVHIRMAQATRNHAANMGARIDKRDAHTHLPGRGGCHNSARSCSIYNNIEVLHTVTLSCKSGCRE